MPLTLIPDEAFITDYLRSVTEVTALGAKVVGTSLGDSAFPWVRMTVVDAPSVSEPVDHLIELYVIFDVFAGRTASEAHRGQEQVSDLTRTVRAALRELPNQTFGDVVVTGVEIDGGRQSPDETVEPARERAQLTVSIWMHPQ